MGGFPARMDKEDSIISIFQPMRWAITSLGVQPFMGVRNCSSDKEATSSENFWKACSNGSEVFLFVILVFSRIQRITRTLADGSNGA